MARTKGLKTQEARSEPTGPRSVLASAASVLACLIIALLPGLVPASASASDPFAEFEVPAPGNSNGGDSIAAGPDGAMWFSEGTAGDIGRVTMGGSITSSPIPPWSVVSFSGQSGRPLWVSTVQEFGGVSRLYTASAAGLVEQTGLEAEFPGELGVRETPEGELLAETSEAQVLYRLTPSGAMSARCSLGTDSGASNMTLVAGGILWFDRWFQARVVELSPSGQLIEFSWPSLNAGAPESMTIGPDGDLWFEDYAHGRIVRVTPSGGFTTFAPRVGSTRWRSPPAPTARCGSRDWALTRLAG